MRFEYYVLNYDFNKKKVENFNVFRNIRVQECTEKAVKKYLKSPKNYRYRQEDIYGFEALCKEIDLIIRWQEWARREYEISVSDAFVTELSDLVRDIDKYSTLDEFKNELVKVNTRNPRLEKWDCYQQCEPNIPMITREIIWQYKQQIKNERKD